MAPVRGEDGNGTRIGAAQSLFKRFLSNLRSPIRLPSGANAYKTQARLPMVVQRAIEEDLAGRLTNWQRLQRTIRLRQPNDGHGMAGQRNTECQPLAEEESVHEHLAERRQLCRQLSARQDRCGSKAAVHRSDVQGDQRHV